MRIPLNTEYKTLIVYFIIHACMPLQFKLYSPKFTNKLLSPAILSFLKLHCRGTHGAVHSLTPKLPPENLTRNLAKK